MADLGKASLKMFVILLRSTNCERSKGLTKSKKAKEM